MKRVLVVGAGSYIGQSFADYARKRFEVEIVDTLHDEWKGFDFSGVDSVVHVAGIAHVTEKKGMEEYYNKINCELAISVAQKAKTQNVKQFIFLSSILVYGSVKSPITLKTKSASSTASLYGVAKHNAEKGLQKLAEDRSHIAIARLPMVYGPGCKGNFPRLARLTKRLPVFPNMKNRRSMIFIDNLSEFLSLLIESGEGGLYFPQDRDYVSTYNIVAGLAQAEGRRVRFWSAFNPFIRILSPFVPELRKMFGDLYYEKEISECFQSRYQIVDFDEAIRKCTEE